MLGKNKIKNLIFSSFENFVKQPISFLKGRLINVTSIQSNLTDKKSITVNSYEDSIQINVINNDKVYNLLSTAMYKKKLRQAHEGMQYVKN